MVEKLWLSQGTVDMLKEHALEKGLKTEEEFDAWQKECVEVHQVMEEKFDFNTVVMSAGDGMITHTFAPECPPGCYGQYEDCKYRSEVVHSHINDKE